MSHKQIRLSKEISSTLSLLDLYLDKSNINGNKMNLGYNKGVTK